jgi:hypothetical protein
MNSYEKIQRKNLVYQYPKENLYKITEVYTGLNPPEKSHLTTQASRLYSSSCSAALFVQLLTMNDLV